MNNCCHQTQHTSCALESLQCCPIAIETIEYFWMYRVARYKAVTIFHFLGFKRKIFRIVLIHLAECITNSIAGCFVLAVQKQSTAYNFKSFVCSNWLPNRLHTSKSMLDCFECLLACLATNLNAGFRNRSNHDAVFTCACSFGNLLNECNEIIERTSRQTFCTKENFCVSNQLVHQNQAGATFVEQVLQVLRAGSYAFQIGITNIFCI